MFFFLSPPRTIISRTASNSNRYQKFGCQRTSGEGHQAIRSSSTGGPDWQHIDVADCQLGSVEGLLALTGAIMVRILFSLVVFYWDMVRSDHLSYEVDLFKTRIRIMSA
jgi:hypothetical protein